jgi:hypothetical protein
MNTIAIITTATGNNARSKNNTTKNISADIMIVMIILPAFCSVPPPRCPLFSISPLSESYELP